MDAAAFEIAADVALAPKPISAPACEDALRLAGDLLPDDLDEWWSDEPRDRLRLRVQQLLLGARRWQDLLRMDPAYEEAHVELLREAVTSGDRRTASMTHDVEWVALLVPPAPATRAECRP